MLRCHKWLQFPQCTVRKNLPLSWSQKVTPLLIGGQGCRHHTPRRAWCHQLVNHHSIPCSKRVILGDLLFREIIVKQLSARNFNLILILIGFLVFIIPTLVIIVNDPPQKCFGGIVRACFCTGVLHRNQRANRFPLLEIRDQQKN